MKEKILIIEDERILIEVLTKKLEQEGYVVFSASDGEQGLAELERSAPDLVLLDIVMPKMNGYEVLDELQRKYGKSKMPPVIIISNSGQPVEIDKALTLGARDYIVKAQFTPDEVINKVESLLGARHASAANQPPAPASPEPQQHPQKKANAEAKVLLVEDDQFLRDLLTTKLEKENFDVVAAIDGPGGIEKITKEQPDVVLLDIILPGIDGFEILKRVRTNVRMDVAKIPIILLSNLGQEADVEKGRALGADDYLIKSNFTIDEIIEKIRSTIATRK
ncbi:MAG: response regulator [Patescibacteria group bacterium]|nr:response regulator [Patescibacteria group bacterium]MDD5715497.1 response regulator [Patescibacteria group bacterium]